MQFISKISRIDIHLNHHDSTRQIVTTILYIIFTLGFFLLSIDLLVTALGHVGRDTAQLIMEVTTNPFVSLFIGLLITALIQSSSTTTAMIVAMVAAGSLEMQQALPMIMGANIGTTITSNLVSLSFITKKDVFSRAFSAATLHDHFNILTTIVVFPMQYKYNFLGLLSDKIAALFSVDQANTTQAMNDGLIKGKWISSEFVMNVVENPVIALILAVVLVFVSIKLFTKIIYKLIIGSAQLKFEKLIFDNRAKSFGWGAMITAGMQSSSVTTSLIVPLVAAGKIKLRDVQSFIVGANVGTTVTALLAALFKSPEAVSIAVAHLMFNSIGTMLWLGMPGLNKLPLLMAEKLGELTTKHRMISLVYIIITFFLLPFAFIYFTK